jgi:glycosidase
VGEAWTSTAQVLEYTGDEVDIAFQFDLAQDIINASRMGRGSVAAQTQNEIVASFPPNQYATFIANHDQNRVMSQLNGDEGKAKTAASILLLGPGVPFIYYGEEIGMMGSKPDEDIRLPMQWAGDSFRAGFTSGTPWRAPFSDFEERNVALQTDDPDSLLSHYRDLIHLRHNHEALRVGDWVLVETNPNSLYAAIRYTDQEIVLVLINSSVNEITDYDLNLQMGPLAGEAAATLLFGEGSVTAPTVTETGGFEAYTPLETLPPQSTFVILLSP